MIWDFYEASVWAKNCFHNYAILYSQYFLILNESNPEQLKLA